MECWALPSTLDYTIWFNQCSSSQEGVSPPGNLSLMWNCLRVCSSCCWLPAKYAAMALWKRISWLCKTFTFQNNCSECGIQMQTVRHGCRVLRYHKQYSDWNSGHLSFVITVKTCLVKISRVCSKEKWKAMKNGCSPTNDFRFLIFNLLQNLLKLTSNVSPFGLEDMNEPLSESVQFLKIRFAGFCQICDWTQKW